MPAEGRLLETCTWEMMRAERGTWDARVGLSELIRDSIFSASLLQASIWEGKIKSFQYQTIEAMQRSVTQSPHNPQRSMTSKGVYFLSALLFLVQATFCFNLYLLHKYKIMNGNQK